MAMNEQRQEVAMVAKPDLTDKIGGTCKTCGMPGHRYGSTDTEHEPSYTACINSLRGKLDDLGRAGAEVVTWLDYYANVHKESSVGDYAKLARKAIEAWERLVPPKED